MDPGCCAEAQSFTAEAEACNLLASDPTLESCCQRDLKEQAVVARLKAQLSIHDRSKERLRVAGRVLGAAPVASAEALQPGSELDDEEDEELGRLQAQRLQQMQREAERKAQLQQVGHGGLADVPESRLLREAESSAVPLVCHVAFEGSPLDDELDEHLVRLAHQHLGTRFVRTLINLRSTLHLRLRSPPGPGLLCFRAGSLVGAAGLDRFGAPECIQEEAVDKWLRQHRVLRLLSNHGGKAPSGWQGGSLQDDSDGGSSGEEEAAAADDWQQPCEVCGRRYPHHHIRSVQATRGSDSESD